MILTKIFLKTLIILIVIQTLNFPQIKSGKVSSPKRDNTEIHNNKESNDDPEYLIKNAKNYFNKKNYEKAIPLLRQVLKLLSSKPEYYSDKYTEVELLLVDALNNLGVAFIHQNKLEEAESLLKETLELGKRIYENSNIIQIGLYLNNLAAVYDKQGYSLKSEQLYKEALDIHRKVYENIDHPDLATCIRNLSIMFINQNRFAEAEPLMKEAVEILKRIHSQKDNPVLATSLNNYGQVLYYLGKYSDAELCYRESLAMNKRIYKNKDNPELASCINNYALLLSGQGRFSESENLYVEALEMNRRIYKNKNHPNLALSINNVAEFYRGQNRNKEAEILYKESLEMNRNIYQNKDHMYLATSINNYALFLVNQGKYEEAELYYMEALEMKRRISPNNDSLSLSTTLNNLAELFRVIGRYSEAEALYDEAILIKRNIYKSIAHPSLAISLNNMAVLLNDQQKYRQALPYYLESINMYKNIIQSNYESLAEKDKEDFLALFGNTLIIVNSFIVKHSKDNRAIINIMYDNCLLMKNLIGQSTRSLRKRLKESDNPELLIIYDKWLEKKEYIAHLYNYSANELFQSGIDIKEIERETKELENELNAKAVRYLNKSEIFEVTWESIESKLKKQDAAIEILKFDLYDQNRYTDTVYYAALILTQETKDNPELVLLENGNELEGELFKEYKDYISVSQYQEKGEDPGDNGKLYDAFWGKIAEKIKGKTRVYLSADGVYNQINLNSLYNPGTKKYVIDETEIVLLTSTRELAVEKKERKYDNMAELFGFPNYDLGVKEQKEIAQDYDLKRKRLLEGVRLTELPGTRIEIEESGNILQKNKWVVNEYLGDNALEENLKKINSPRLLHIATHGVFLGEEQIEREKKFSLGIMGDQQKIYYDNPLLRSALFLSGANRSRKGINVEGIEDGVFTGYEAQNLNLMNTELVILSACETGLGVVKSGEGVYGLQRAFRVAGAENIIMSLWKVSDEATKDLILSFYKKWTKGKSVKEAFREAQRELRDKYPGAYYWAAFVLIGG